MDGLHLFPESIKYVLFKDILSNLITLCTLVRPPNFLDNSTSSCMLKRTNGKAKYLHWWLVRLSIHHTTEKPSAIDKVCTFKNTSIHTVLTNAGVSWWMLIRRPNTPQQALTDEAAVAVFVNVRPNNEVLFLLPFLLKVTLYCDGRFKGAERCCLVVI